MTRACWWIAAAVAALIVAAVLRPGARGASAEAPSEAPFVTAPVARGEVVATIEASGTVQPLVLVEVGAQVTAVVEKVLKDFNSPVRAGETIAVLDTRRLAAQVKHDRAARKRAESDVKRTEATLVKARRELDRKRTLQARRLVTEADVDAATADVAALEAELAATQAAVEQSEASLEISETNLGYATIVSPIDGVVVSRKVDAGQTLAASLSAPTLFTIAQDLSQVRVEASVPEADVGRIREGAVARFTVDAHLDLTFEGRVSQVRLAATTVQNVVTYVVVIDAANPEKLLFPGMTATVRFEVARSAKDALSVPNAALRFTPQEALVEGRRDASAAFVYVPLSAGRLRAVAVDAGVSDGIVTAVEPITPGALVEGAAVATSLREEETSAAANPFGPPKLGGDKNGGGAK